ncbi:hypothetical protein Pmar_PMAR017641 [Perkinsus marinus ATCC 50983]|uniref:Rab-GAP TBC domain-containing protein n=1 Tax=Perkinsus marinus (strain ATCC 50983 / TXsc) TaxID=423536 RepID=C5L3L0_PERM5|nr:hypothetical protein Pmar_PMAR017641 [Perkinsus marinus ATCC 50983]EER08589.1 hypothetical protein Pmar_PMAR017641 [Perkinsus marinus ATCC 50983]|eukprot:XP_002776773.1 hypothetical protein Pmar_PMAR017641 [Perkinsus marinus ATCC 50983]
MSESIPQLEEATAPSAHPHILLGFVLLWMVAEAIAYAWYRRRLALRNATPAVVPVVSSEQRDFVFDNVLDLGKYYPDGVWRLLKGWFHPSLAQQDLRQDNLNEMLAWAFCYKDTADLTSSEWQWVEKAKAMINDRYGYSPKPGRADVTTVRNTLDPIVSNYHPLSFYCGVVLAKAFGAVVLRLRGYHHYSSGRVWYWYRSRPALEETLVDQGESSEEVFVFFHGIGIGLVTYLTMIFKLKQKTQFLFEMPWISMNPLAEVVPDDEYAIDVRRALKDQGVTNTQRLCLAGHSFGSLPVVWLKRHCPDVFNRSRVVLMDPVCIYLNLPDVCLNFLYRKPRRLFMRFLRYIASEELGIACCLHRDFFWMQSVIFPQELPQGSTVFLSEYDHFLWRMPFAMSPPRRRVTIDSNSSESSTAASSKTEVLPYEILLLRGVNRSPREVCGQGAQKKRRQIQIHRIFRALATEPTIDLYELQVLAHSPMGFVNSGIRRSVWSALLGISNGGESRGQEEEEAEILSLQEVEKSYPIINTRRCSAMLENLCLFYLSDLCFYPFQHALLPGLDLSFALLEALDPELYHALVAADIESPHFAVPWVLTLMTHNLPTLEMSQRLMDSLLVSHPAIIYYYVPCLLIMHRDDILHVEPFDMPHLHQFCQNLPSTLDMPSLERLIGMVWLCVREVFPLAKLLRLKAARRMPRGSSIHSKRLLCQMGDGRERAIAVERRAKELIKDQRRFVSLFSGGKRLKCFGYATDVTKVLSVTAGCFGAVVACAAIFWAASTREDGIQLVVNPR